MRSSLVRPKASRDTGRDGGSCSALKLCWYSRGSCCAGQRGQDAEIASRNAALRSPRTDASKRLVRLHSGWPVLVLPFHWGLASSARALCRAHALASCFACRALAGTSDG